MADIIQFPSKQRRPSDNFSAGLIDLSLSLDEIELRLSQVDPEIDPDEHKVLRDQCANIRERLKLFT